MSAAQPAPDRRAVIAGSLGLAAAVAATAATMPAMASTSGEADALLARLDLAASRYRQAQAAYADALAAHEADLPRLPPSLDFTGMGGASVGMSCERGHGNSFVIRGIAGNGSVTRIIATTAFLQRKIDERTDLGSSVGRYLYRLRRRARKYEAATKAAEERHRLDDLLTAQQRAQMEISIAAEAFHDCPLTSAAMVVMQARAICIIDALDQGVLFNRDWLLGRYGVKLAQAIQAGAA